MNCNFFSFCFRYKMHKKCFMIFSIYNYHNFMWKSSKKYEKTHHPNISSKDKQKCGNIRQYCNKIQQAISRKLKTFSFCILIPIVYTLYIHKNANWNLLVFGSELKRINMHHEFLSRKNYHNFMCKSS